ncbi:hypothetical protein LMG9964_06277 [Paraburkholderia phenoliruptrix]|uniref:Uncharacterized protein n=1 Tax=Paraburkholderia phenoliruptrix TaxID=252970 RepID=A0A6J5KG79_9BURK|nr:hypothetical protein LMG9964_06277 [Paraburkholderia phenoliruptrix]
MNTEASQRSGSPHETADAGSNLARLTIAQALAGAHSLIVYPQSRHSI